MRFLVITAFVFSPVAFAPPALAQTAPALPVFSTPATQTVVLPTLTQQSNGTYTTGCPSGSTLQDNQCITQTCPAGMTHSGSVCNPGSASSASSNISDFVPLAPIPGLTQGYVANSSDLASFLNNLYKYLIGLAAVLAVIQIIRGGLEYATQDSVSKNSEGRHHIEQAIFGLVLVLLPALVFGIINPDILHLSQLSIDLRPLPPDTAAGTSTPAAAGATAVNGQVSGVYLQKLTTTDQSQVQSFTNSCGLAGGALTNSCPTTNSQTNNPNCSAASTLECENYAPTNPYSGTNQTIWMFFGAPSLADVIPNLADSAAFAVSTTKLIPAVSAEISLDTQFINQCNADGGVVCTTDATTLIENYDYISCPAASQQPTYSQPVGTQPYCFKMALFCADPNLPTNGCTSGWSFQLSQ